MTLEEKKERQTLLLQLERETRHQGGTFYNHAYTKGKLELMRSNPTLFPEEWVRLYPDRFEWGPEPAPQPSGDREEPTGGTVTIELQRSGNIVITHGKKLLTLPAENSLTRIIWMLHRGRTVSRSSLEKTVPARDLKGFRDSCTQTLKKIDLSWKEIIHLIDDHYSFKSHVQTRGFSEVGLKYAD